jgi:hypothetical protein
MEAVKEAPTSLQNGLKELVTSSIGVAIVRPLVSFAKIISVS